MILAKGIFGGNLSSILMKFLLIGISILVLVSTINTKNLDDVDQSNEERFDPETIFADDLNILARAAPRFGRAAPRFGRRFAALSLARLQHPGNYMFNDDTDDGRNENFSEERKRASPRYGRSF